MDIFGSLKRYITPEKVRIDNNAFRLCTKVTFTILLGASFVVTAQQYFGAPIDCIAQGISPHVMNAYCWFSSTYTLTNHLVGIAGRDMIEPGVASHSDSDELKYHRYYQWVCFVLFFQAMISYVPRYIWKTFEGGRMKELSRDLRNPILEKSHKDTHTKIAVDYIHENFNRHNFYAYRFFICEFLNFGIAIGQFYFTNYFLDGEFLNYGLNVIQWDEMESSPMARVFPKLTKCIFHKYGPSGSIQKYDGLCVLALNVINEKVYLVLWYWFIFMIFVSGIAVIYRVIVLSTPRFRACLLRARGKLASRSDINFIHKRCDVGDWFLIYQISKNVDGLAFKNICRALLTELHGMKA